MNIKKIQKSIFFILIINIVAHAQAFLDPQDDIYKYFDRWITTGYVDFLPPLRPYPQEILEKGLLQVIERGDRQSRNKAKSFLEEIKKNDSSKYYNQEKEKQELEFSSPVFTPLAKALINISDNDFFAISGAGFLLDYRLNSLIYAAADWSLLLVDKQNGESLSSPSPPARSKQLEGMAQPEYSGFPLDMVADSSNMSIAGRTYYIKQSIHSIINMGDSRLYTQIGLVRSSFGPFFSESIVLSPSSQHAIRYNLVYYALGWTYSAIYMDLVATNNIGEGANTGKHLRINSLEWNIGKNIRAGLFETVLWGPDFNLYYLIPLGELTYQQIYAGAPDNSLFGLSLTVRTPYRFRYDIMLYVDDLEFYDLVKLNFNTLYKASIQTAIKWVPLYKSLKDISLEYILITPYMYTHKDSDTYNYLNYTHDGLSLALQLPPNSDRLMLAATIEPLDWVTLSPKLSFTRHANASEGIADIAYPADGSIFDAGYTTTGYPSFDAQPTRFMTQDTIEKTLEAGLDAGFAIETESLDMKIELAYKILYTWNYNLIAGNNKLQNYISINSKITW
ncbi:hypothetical protein WKV44_01530 [Spirochaetia bacterium 38H-sp]|uniref:Capsule assembly Wzi family protein n=1 Tax=Rarispira pelagica TaxID=3141764 RepID=A0ABU9U978_9SPIR